MTLLSFIVGCSLFTALVIVAIIWIVDWVAD